MSIAETGIQPGGGGGLAGGDDIPTAPEWALIVLGAILLWQMARARQVGRTIHSAWPIAALILLAAASQAMANESLQFDARGNVKSRTVDGTASTYRYDRIDRLNQETGVASQSIGLDANANRTSDGAATYTVLANGNRITTRNGVALTYDPEGNLFSDQTTLNGSAVARTFTYTLAGQLKTVSVGGTLRATYTYNHLNQRTRKVLASPAAGIPATTLYRYDTQGHLVEEIAGSAASTTGISVTAGQSLVTYVWKDDTPSAVIYAPNSPGNPGNASERIVYLHTDHLDTPRKATDSQARVVWRWNSDAFGSTVANEDVDGNGIATPISLRFPGQYFDAESGLHYNWHRYYDPPTGRYVQSDPIGLAGGINTFVYAIGSPISHADPLGLAVTCNGTWRIQSTLVGSLPLSRTSSPMPSPVCMCFWLCMPCRGQVAWSGNRFDLPATQGFTFVDFSGSGRPATGSGGIRPTPTGPSTGGGAGAGGSYTCICKKPGDETGCHACYADDPP